LAEPSSLPIHSSKIGTFRGSTAATITGGGGGVTVASLVSLQLLNNTAPAASQDAPFDSIIREQLSLSKGLQPSAVNRILAMKERSLIKPRSGEKIIAKLVLDPPTPQLQRLPAPFVHKSSPRTETVS